MSNLNQNPRYDHNASRPSPRNVASTMEAQRPRPIESAPRRSGQDLASQGHAEPVQEDIRLRAYQIFVERGATPGHEVDDWLQAERELREPRQRQ